MNNFRIILYRYIFVFSLISIFIPVSASAFFQVEVVDNLVVIEQVKLREQLKFDPEYREFMSKLRINGNDADALNGLGFKLIEYDKLDSAEDIFKKSIKLDDSQALAHSGLGLTYFRKGRSRLIMFEAFKKIVRRDNYSKSISEFRRALDIDPGHHDSRFHLAEVHIAKAGDDDLRKAYNQLEELIRRNPDYPKVHFLLGKTYFEQENYSKAEQEFILQIGIDGKHSSSKIYLGRTYFRAGSNEKATEVYLDGLESLTGQVILEEIYMNMRPVFTKEENERYLSLATAYRGKYLSDFWRKKNPNLITKTNERLIEHLRRTDVIKSQYHENNRRGYDDRGLIYLKYGEPDVKHTETAKMENVSDNESWLYTSINKNLAFDFVTNGGTYRLVPNLSYATRPKSLAAARKLYLERSYMGGIYTQIGGMAISGSDLFLRDILIFESRKNEAVQVSPPQYYNHKIMAVPINFPISIVQFKGDEKTTVVEVYYGIPLGQLEFSPVNSILTASVISKVVILDSNFVYLDELSRRRTIQIDNLENARSNYQLGDEKLALTPGKYNFGLQLNQENTQRLGMYQLVVPVKDYSSNELMISDIRFSSQVNTNVGVEIRSRDDLSMRPYPFNYVSASRPLTLYFEVYNLETGVNGRTSYDVEFALKRQFANSDNIAGVFKKISRFVMRKKAEYISMKQERTGSRPTAREYISIDISSIPESDAILTVVITDKISGHKSLVEMRVQIRK